MMTRYQVFFSVLAMGAGCLEIFGQSTNRIPEAMVTIRVMDEEGGALTSLPVHVWFDNSVVLDGVTDSNGLYVAHGKCSTIDPPIRIEKEGYYTSAKRYRFTNIVDKIEYQWQPWNPVVTMIVRRVVNPIPMYVRHVDMKIPVEGVPVAFDLRLGDWLAPYGEGQVPDLIFQMTRRVTSPSDYEGTLRVAFTNTLDGMQKFDDVIPESEFRFPRFAPEDGYQGNYSYFHGKSPAKGYYGARLDDPKRDCVFRVRSVLNNEGRLKEAMYGKLIGGIEFTGVASSNNVRVLFTYYLNPTLNDKNLEFDPKRNLFTNLISTEQVTAP